MREIREGKLPGMGVLMRGDSTRSLEARLEIELPIGRIAVQEPVAVYPPCNVAAATRQYRWVRGDLVFGTKLTGMMNKHNSAPLEKGVHCVEHLLHSSTVVFVFLMNLTQYVYKDESWVYAIKRETYRLLAKQRCYKEGHRHIIRMGEPKVRNREIDALIGKTAEALSPRGFFGVKLEVENLLRPAAGAVTKDGLAFRYPGCNVPCKEALARLWWPHQEEVTRAWDKAFNDPTQRRAWENAKLLWTESTQILPAS